MARKIGIFRAGETVSFVFDFCFPLRLEVSLLFIDIKTKAEVRNAAESWKLGVNRNFNPSGPGLFAFRQTGLS